MSAPAKAKDAYRLPEPTNASKAQISKFAESVASSLGYSSEVSIEGFVKRIGGRISYLHPEDSVSDIAGSLLVQGKGDFEIILSGMSGTERNKFTIAHELGHYFLHYLYQNPSGKFMAKRSGSDRVEWEANWFAGGFLMPTAEFKRVYAKFDRSLEYTSLHFGVSQVAAKVRAQVLSLPLK